MKMLLTIFTILMLIIVPIQAYAEGEITITVDSQPLTTDVAPQIINGRTMLPMRAIFERLGAKVTWISEDKLIFATKDELLITMKIGLPKMSVQKTGNNESTVIPLETAPYIVNDKTLVPVRAVAEALGAKVTWINETRTVMIATK